MATFWLPVRALPPSKTVAVSERAREVGGEQHATGMQEPAAAAGGQPILTALDRPGGLQLLGDVYTTLRMGRHAQRGSGPLQGSTATGLEPAKNA